MVIGFEQQLEGKDLSKARPYSPKDSYVLDEVLSHPTFGVGLVTGVRDDKIDVAFKAAQKTLVHGRGDGAERPVFHPASPVVNAPADKPGAIPEPTPGELPGDAADESAQDEEAAPV